MTRIYQPHSFSNTKMVRDKLHLTDSVNIIEPTQLKVRSKASIHQATFSNGGLFNMFGPQLNSMYPQSFKIDQNHQGLQRKYPGMERPRAAWCDGKNPCPCLRSCNELPTEARYWQCSLIRWRLAKSGVFFELALHCWMTLKFVETDPIPL